MELEIDEESFSGTFQQGETVIGVSTVTDQDVSFTPYSIINGSSVTNSGAYYTADQIINLSSGGSNTATAKVQTVTRGVVDEIIIDDAGQNYAVGEFLTFNNANTDGVSAQHKYLSCWWWYRTREWKFN